MERRCLTHMRVPPPTKPTARRPDNHTAAVFVSVEVALACKLWFAPIFQETLFPWTVPLVCCTLPGRTTVWVHPRNSPSLVNRLFSSAA